MDRLLVELGQVILGCIIGVLVTSLYFAVLRVRLGIAKRTRMALCQGRDHDDYYVHLPELGEMTSSPKHWCKWGTGSWMYWVDERKRNGKIPTGSPG